ncbi:hypothetical protein [Photobacterium sp. NCIMB 13483]|uniref:hypothetical protein n=1 Tax=Photobacterium sp. NCIMB 13483 TaxID=2022103 RepID=UPI0018EE01CA|nr:hypothetical protein [Photobacterium sp. NCIMB 13483]
MPSTIIKETLSAARIGTYETAIGLNGNPLSTEHALKLYGWNAQVSAAFFSPLHLCEVVIRNAVASALEAKYGDRWPWSPSFEGSLPNPNKGYNPRKDLINSRKRMLTTGKVIPELNFVFWQKMLTSRFDSRLWDSHLHQVFPNHVAGTSVSVLRCRLHNDLEQVRKLRNRIAHHEPIIARNLDDDFEKISSLIEVRCLPTSNWMMKNQFVTPLMSLKPF